MTTILLRAFIIGLLTVTLLFFGVKSFYGDISRVVADEKFQTIVIFPSEAISGDWKNIDLAKTQDLSDNAIYNLFNPSNSAYIASAKYISDYSAIASASGTGEAFSNPIVDDNNKDNSEPEPELESEPEIESGLEPELKSESESEIEIGPELEQEPVLEIKESSEIAPNGDSSTTVDAEESNIPPEIPESIEPEISSPEVDSSSESSEEVASPPTSVEVNLLSVKSGLFALGEAIKNLFAIDAWAQEETPAVSVSSCDGEGVECTSRRLEFGGFGVADAFDGQPIKNIQLRFSLAGTVEQAEEEEIDAGAYSRIIVEYFIDDIWTRAGEVAIGDEISNATNGGYFLYALPFIDSWEGLDDFRVRLVLETPNGADVNVFIDGLWLEMEINSESELSLDEVIVEKGLSELSNLELSSEAKDFYSGQAPVFKYNYSREKGFFEVIASTIARIFNSQKSVTVSAVSSRMGIRPVVEYGEDGYLSIKIDNPGYIRPGKHNIKIDIDDNGRQYEYEQEFLWGSLILNLDRSIYRPGGTVRASIVVLDDTGRAVCNGNVSATIKSSLSRITSFSTESGSIRSNPQCGLSRENGRSDYYFEYLLPSETGIYEIEIMADTKNGPRTVTESFEIAESAGLVIERKFPSVINPGHYQEAIISVSSYNDFDGVLEERVPLGFDIFSENITGGDFIGITNDSSGKTISWQISLKAGDSIDLGYTFAVPELSPAFYLIGPARAGEFSEKRLWHLLVQGDSKISSFTLNPPHRCSIDPFVIEAQRGEEKSLDISLNGSSFGNYFILMTGDLPPEVNLVLDEVVGITPVEIGATLDVRPDAKTGSFNYSIIYQEPQDNGRVLSTSCQFNLIVK